MFQLQSAVCKPGFVCWVLLCSLHIGMVRAGDQADNSNAPRATKTPASKIHANLASHLKNGDPTATVKAWVMFVDKGREVQQNVRAATADLATRYNRRAIQRRKLRRTRPGLFDYDDLPVDQTYIKGVVATGAQLHVKSRWLNAISVTGNKQQLEQISRLGFVKQVRRVAVGRRITPPQPVEVDRAATGSDPAAVRGAGAFYGEAEEQLTQMNLIALHNAGFTGAGVVVGVMDSGFKTTHVAFNNVANPLQVVAEFDFVDNDPNPQGEFFHGTFVVGTMGAYAPNDLVGGCYDASYILCRTEDGSSETPAEEDNMVAALEFIEANGGDLATTSLGYLTFQFDFAEFSYTQADMDGVTAISTIGVNIATDNGLHVLTSVGNGGNDLDDSSSTLGAPADAFKIISVGAVTDTGAIASFSSTGPTADGRVKPEVLARGVNTRSTPSSTDTTYGGSNGTSFSAPLAAAAVACLTQAHPEWTVDQMRNYLFRRADGFVATGTADPLFIRGYGIIDAFASLNGDCDDNGIDDATDIADSTHEDCDGNGLPDICDVAALGDALDCNSNGGIDFCDVTQLGAPDCNANLVPDECDADCNADGQPDDCEANAAENDCDFDGVCNGAQIAACSPGDPACTDCNLNSVPDACDILSGFAADNNENGIPDLCDAAIPLIPPHPHSFKKNRFISIDPNNNLIPVALRVELLDLACSVTGLKCNDDSECKECDAGPDQGKGCIINSDCGGGALCVLSVETCIEQSPPILLGWVDDPFEPQGDRVPPGLMAAHVTKTMPNLRLWTEAVVHIGDCEIAPHQTYAISATTNGAVFTAPLVLGTILQPQGKHWGDLVGSFNGATWSAPDNLVGVNDVNAMLKFLSLKPAPHITVIELGGEVPNFLTNVSDLGLVIEAFKGGVYPPKAFFHQGPPADCP